MADWKRVIVGNALKLPNKSPRYYVDLALVPVAIYSLLIGIIAIWSWPPATWNRVDALWAGATILFCLVLAKERTVVFGAATAYFFFIGLRLLGVMLLVRLLGFPLGARWGRPLFWVEVVFAAGAGLLALGFFRDVAIRRGASPVLYDSVHPLADKLISLAALIIVVALAVRGLLPVWRYYFD